MNDRDGIRAGSDKDDRDDSGSLQAVETGSVGMVVTGDNHLSAYLPRLTTGRRAERRQRLRAGFAAAVSYAIEHGAGVFLQLGDLFDTPTPDNQERAFVAGELARLRRAGIICVGIGGNHDSPRMQTEHGGASPQQSYVALDGLDYFPRHDALVPRLFAVNGLRLAIAGLSNHPTARPGSDPLAAARIEDPTGVLAEADMAVLLLHAGIEGLTPPLTDEKLATRASIAALPAIFRVIVGGHIHRFGREQIGERTAIVCGSTERMEFGHADGSSGFAWMQVTRDGVKQIEHIRVAEQPRADIVISTAQLWPPNPPNSLNTQKVAQSTLPDALELPIADATGPLPPLGAAQERRNKQNGQNTPRLEPMAIIQQKIAEVATPETIVRLRLVGPLEPEQYHQLAIRALLTYGQQTCFSFELDTSGLILTHTVAAGVGALAHAGPISPLREAETVLEERLAGVAAEDYVRAEDERSAAAMLMARLRAGAEQEAGG